MLTGILLIGGKSSRMGQDKSELIYHGEQTERERLFNLLDLLCDKVYLCHRADQNFNQDCIIDPGDGPLAAIYTAFETCSDSGLLVLACDIPLLKSEDLEYLITERDLSAKATFYLSNIDNRPEPLCAIYEPDLAPIIKEAIVKNNYCPRNLLEKVPTKKLILKNSNALMNANSPAEKIEVISFINQTRTMKTIQLKYFAQLKEIAQKDSERVETEACTPAGLFEEIKQRYQCPHKHKQLMVAINEDFSAWNHVLQDGDEVVFIPPVAGG